MNIRDCRSSRSRRNNYRVSFSPLLWSSIPPCLPFYTPRMTIVVVSYFLKTIDGIRILTIRGISCRSCVYHSRKFWAIKFDEHVRSGCRSFNDSLFYIMSPFLPVYRSPVGDIHVSTRNWTVKRVKCLFYQSLKSTVLEFFWYVH